MNMILNLVETNVLSVNGSPVSKLTLNLSKLQPILPLGEVHSADHKPKLTFLGYH